MIKSMVISIIFLSSIISQAQPSVECLQTSIHVETNKSVKWSNNQAPEKLMIIRNEATGKYYPRELTKSTSGSLSIKDFPSNKRGYKIILVDASAKALALVESKTKDCVKAGDCSMELKDIELTKKACNFLVSPVFYP